MSKVDTTLGPFNADVLTIASSFVAIYVIYSTASAIYDVFFGHLSKFPGPKLWAFSKLPRNRTMIAGNDANTLTELHQKYGPIVRTGPDSLSFASGAQAWKDIYGFKKHGTPHPFKDPEFYTYPLNGVPSVIMANDADHGRERKVLSHAFSDKALKEQEPLLKRWAALMRKKLSERANGMEKADLLKYYNCTTFDIMGDLTFSESLDMLEGSEYSPWVKTIFESIKRSTLFRGLRTYNRLFMYVIDEWIFKSKKVRDKAWEHWSYTTERVDRRLKREPEHEDLWSKILEKEDTDGGMTRAEHESNASLFMIAGTETTATALSGVTYHLLKTPAAMKELVEEIRTAFTDFDDVTLEAVARLNYLDAVLREGLRMYPPVPIGLPRRTPPEGCIICDKYVPGGTSIAASHFATYRMSQNFRDAYEFHPERWLGDPTYKDDNLDAVEPFSVGPRNCLGKNLAWHEMRVLLVSVLLHFDLQLCDESHDWSDQKVYTLWEKKPLLCTLTPISKA